MLTTLGKLAATIAVGFLLMGGSHVYAGVGPGDLCKEAKAKAAGKKASHVLKTFGRYVKNWDIWYLGHQQLEAQKNLTRRFMAAESKGGCETAGDWDVVGARVNTFVDDVLPDLLPRGFVDNGDGTITDPWTGLMWEKKDNAGGLHDLDHKYPWALCCGEECHPGDWWGRYCQPTAEAAAACSAQAGGAVGCNQCPQECSQGTTIWVWLLEVNSEGGTGFAGYSNWRIPDVKRGAGKPELETIVRLETRPWDNPPSVEPVFNTGCTEGCSVTTCSCTTSGLYLSSRTYSASANFAESVSFDTGRRSGMYKEIPESVRAVRGPD